MSFEALNKIADFYASQSSPKAKEAGIQIANLSQALFEGDNIPRRNGLTVLHRGEQQFTNIVHEAMDFSYNKATGKIKNNNGEDGPKFTNMETEIMNLLTSHPGVVLSRDRIYESVIGYPDFGEGHTIDVHIGSIRGKLPVGHKRSKEIVETITKKGYQYNHFEKASPSSQN